MTIHRQKLREVVFLLLYSHDFSNYDLNEFEPLLKEKLKVSTPLITEAFQQFQKIKRELVSLDQIISQNSQNYSLDRIQNIEKNILRLAIFEILYDEKIPPKVAISEAIRLCKKFASLEAGKFVNAILDKIYKTTARHEFSS